jgi:hypothetical protein
VLVPAAVDGRAFQLTVERDGLGNPGDREFAGRFERVAGARDDLGAFECDGRILVGIEPGRPAQVAVAFFVFRVDAFGIERRFDLRRDQVLTGRPALRNDRDRPAHG